MKKELALKIILYISLGGMLFSGYLSYSELFKEVCPLAGGCTAVAGIPVCVYGFFMYLVIFIISIIGLRKK